jgi:prolyl oligopeptidase
MMGYVFAGIVKVNSCVTANDHQHFCDRLWVMTIRYPVTKTVDQLDDYHGTQVADPYRWLEQPADTPEVRSWIEAQNAVTEAFLSTIPERETLRRRLTELWDYPKVSAPFKKGGRYFQLRNSGLQNQFVLYVMETLADAGRVLLDPNALSEDGTVALQNFALSPDGRYLAYSLSRSGSDWQTWQVRDVATGEDLPDQLPWSKFSGASWLRDGSGFFYVQYPAPKEGSTYTAENANPVVKLHRLGSAPEDDVLVYERPDEPRWMFDTEVTPDGKLLLYIARSTEPKNLLYYRPEAHQGDFVPLIDRWEARYHYVGNDGGAFYLYTDAEAELGQVICLTVTAAGPQRKTMLAEAESKLERVALLQDTFIALYLHDASNVLKTFDLNGRFIADIRLPGLGTVSELYAERNDSEAFYSFTSFLTPSTPYRFDLSTGEVQQLGQSPLPFDPSPYVVRQVFATSNDGTKVPMFLVHHQNLRPDGSNPTLLYGYGGFNIPLTPAFSVSRLVFLERGGVLAVANLRGGGEYGKAWHQAGTVHQKQNVFDDCIACAEWLIAEGITSPQKLAVQGGSNGGLLVGAVMTQRPDLFAVALPAVGVLDMLRFHKFTIGWAWVSDYGSADDPDEFKTLYAYSPLHNLKKTTYPATLVTTGDHDDRVVPAHSFKFIAALQTHHTGDSPVLIRIQTKAGHGQGKPTRLLIDEQADIWAFVFAVLRSSYKVLH